MNNIKYWIWLSRIDKIGIRKKLKLLEIYKTPETIWNLSKEEMIKNNTWIDEKTTDVILDKTYRDKLELYEQYMKDNNIEIITLYDKYYPEKLKKIYDKPIVLYVKGNKKILNNFSLAIIGCRESSKYGEEACKRIANEISRNKIVTVSGLARGIDSISQKETVRLKEKTIAVIGSGLDNIYPKENEKLAEEIIKNGGAIVSEYIVGTKPLKMNFPARNRIISGISDGVVVVEAKEKSGTMITVDFALEHGKEVFVIPGSIFNQNSKGTNQLIQQGAKLITSLEDILEEF